LASKEIDEIDKAWDMEQEIFNEYRKTPITSFHSQRSLRKIGQTR